MVIDNLDALCNTAPIRRVIGDPSRPLPMTGILAQRVKQQKVTLSTTPQKVTLDSLLGFQMTNRGTPTVSFSTYGNEDGVYQVETNTIASAVTKGGNLAVTVTAFGMTGSPATITAAALGTFQQESIACTGGAITKSGNITLTLTAAALAAPEAVVVPVVLADDVNAVGLALRTALGLNANIIAKFAITGTGAAATITAKTAVADDATMAFVFADTDTTGVTFGASTDTTAGVKASTAAEIAEIVKTALNADAVIGAFFTATRSGSDVILTRKAFAANDTTMLLTVTTGTAIGLTSSSSVNTMAGYAVGDWDEIGNIGTVYQDAPMGCHNDSPFTFIWLKSASGTPYVLIRGWKEV